MNPGKIYARLKGWQRRVSSPSYQLQDQYVVDFKPIPDWEDGGPNQYLGLLRRIPEGVSPAEAWRDFERRAELYRNGIDENRALMNEGYPRKL